MARMTKREFACANLINNFNDDCELLKHKLSVAPNLKILETAYHLILERCAAVGMNMQLVTMELGGLQDGSATYLPGTLRYFLPTGSWRVAERLPDIAMLVGMEPESVDLSWFLPAIAKEQFQQLLALDEDDKVVFYIPLLKRYIKDTRMFVRRPNGAITLPPHDRLQQILLMLKLNNI